MPKCTCRTDTLPDVEFSSINQTQITNLYSHATAANNLPGFSLLVNLTKASPFTKLLVVVNLEQVDVVLSTQGFY